MLLKSEALRMSPFQNWNIIKACDAAHIKEDVPYVYTAFVDLMLLDPTFTWYQ